MPIEISDADAEALGVPDKGKLAEFIDGLDLETDRIKARQAVIDQKDSQLRAFTELGLSADEIKALKDSSKNAPSDKDVEKRIAEVTAEQTAKADAKARAAEVRAQAAELGFIKPTQALALLDSKKLAEVKVDENGDADEAAVKALLEALKTDSPHLLKPTDTTADHRTAGIGSTGSGDKPEVRPGTDRIRQAYANTPKK
jgi:tyrosyl-tRNA synthetase